MSIVEDGHVGTVDKFSFFYTHCLQSDLFTFPFFQYQFLLHL